MPTLYFIMAQRLYNYRNVLTGAGFTLSNFIGGGLYGNCVSTPYDER
jgi:hypothetical protein